MEYRSFDPWTTFPKDICSKCGYSGSFAIEWVNDKMMADYHPHDSEHRKKEAYAIEHSSLQNVVRFFGIIAIITYLLILIMMVITAIK
ncbi:hypothetical protein [uncultured Methanospirillum sp.]|uniref:hypothetical protein n=1 Tax=uncultured Methanospirillum sp. TaxID=262503 RepID=UPI0029C68434|nr:hypothetical protein [uncultured Methanospirillum sp.]